jgi:hypothetical protein
MNARFLILLGLVCGLCGMSPSLFAQGCVQSRGAGLAVLLQGEDTYLKPGDWQASVGYRWLHSDRHFIGGEEQPQRQARGDQVINDSHFIDLTATYGVTKRLSLSLTLPFVYSSRSSWYEHDRMHRYTMEAGGLADVRLTSLMWILDPKSCHNGNVGFGLGLKAPTGDYEATDISHTTSGPMLRYVDQSIQPGDGGWGIILQMQGFQRIYKGLFAYTDLSYMITPEEKHEDQPISTGYSIPDSYLLRAGLSYGIWPSKGLSLSLGARMEGVPVEDWVGGSEGSRRPGYSISIEPGITWAFHHWAFTVTAPVAIERNREASVSDLRNGRHGDAAFADFIITSNISFRF